jgi:hypothetical protein
MEHPMQNGTLKVIAGTVVGIPAMILLAIAAIRVGENLEVPPPKPYEQAIYDVYSDLLQTKRSWWIEWIDPLPKAILIRTETKPGVDQHVDDAAKIEALLRSEKRFKQAVDLAIADYIRRNSGILELRRQFNLSTYDLITSSEERGFFQSVPLKKGEPVCEAVHRKHPGYQRWVILSAVGFNDDQTMAVVYIENWRAGRSVCSGIISGGGGYRLLQKWSGRWHVIGLAFDNWVT